MRIFALGLLSTFLLVACDSDTPTRPPIDPDYPTIIPPLSADALQARKLEYAAANPRICSSLDEYGFPFGLCTRGSQGVSEAPDVDRLIELAKETIVANSGYTGVGGPEDLTPGITYGSLSIFRVNFTEQILKGLIVEGTNLQVNMDSLGVLGLHGHHYADAIIPPPAYSSAEAQRNLIGESITWYDFGGQPHTFLVSREDLVEEPVRVILPRTTWRGIELRVAWRIPVRQGWWAYVDTMTGKHLLIRQLFRT